MAVSVVIPAWNREAHIAAALNSIIAQRDIEWEAIVVDDGSTDNTSEVVGQLGVGDSRIRLIKHRSQRGAQAARNTGIHAARYEFVAFLDSDDQFLPASLSSRVRLAKEEGTLCVHSEALVLRPGEVTPRPMGVRRLDGWIESEVLAQPGPMFQGMLIAKAALTRIGYLDEDITSWQEWDTAIRLSRFYQFSFLPEATFLYDCRHQSTISKDALRCAVGYQQVCSKHRIRMLMRLGPRGMAAHYSYLGRLYAEANEWSHVVRCRRKAKIAWPFS